MLDNTNENSEDETDIDDNDEKNLIISDEPPLIPQPGDRLEVHWPLENKHYPGTVSSVTQNEHSIQYDDGDKEKINLDKEDWRWDVSNNSIAFFKCNTTKKMSANSVYNAQCIWEQDLYEASRTRI